MIERAVRPRLAFGLYLAALALLPFKWLSPFGHPQAGVTDLLVAAAAAAWVVERLRRRAPIRLRAPHYAGAAYLAAVALSAAFAAGRRAAAEDLLIAAELAALALLTADYARRPEGRRAIAGVILGVTFVTALEAVIGLILFWAGDSTSLVQQPSGYFESSRVFARASAGFFSAPLLGSFCIFASAILAMGGNGLSRRMRLAGQVVLAALVVLTLSRAMVGFAVAAAIRGGRRLGIAAAIAGVAAMVVLSVAPTRLDPFRPKHWSGTNPRLTVARSSAKTLARHPLVGKGPGSLTGRYSRGGAGRAHLTPLNVAATAGPAALVALTSLVVLLWRRRRRPTNVAIWSGLAGLGIDALGQDVEHFRHVWVMLGMADADRDPNEGGR